MNGRTDVCGEMLWFRWDDGLVMMAGQYGWITKARLMKGPRCGDVGVSRLAREFTAPGRITGLGYQQAAVKCNRGQGAWASTLALNIRPYAPDLASNDLQTARMDFAYRIE